VGIWVRWRVIRTVDRGMQSISIMAAQQVVQRTLPALERQLDEVIAGKPGVIDLVMSAVQIVDSTGLNWLLALQARLETLGIRMRLVDPSPVMADVLLATRLDARFTVEVTGGPGNGHLAGGDNAR
jgi:anti-anti-sigma factor